ncbi:hypothetical protein BD770DRAFT_416640 [Pilaira anomala]|nr:hypothetical protein BD770DRAFT_416640 [Pilaira anomala]
MFATQIALNATICINPFEHDMAYTKPILLDGRIGKLNANELNGALNQLLTRTQLHQKAVKKEDARNNNQNSQQTNQGSSSSSDVPQFPPYSESFGKRTLPSRRLGAPNDDKVDPRFNVPVPVMQLVGLFFTVIFFVIRNSQNNIWTYCNYNRELCKQANKTMGWCSQDSCFCTSQGWIFGICCRIENLKPRLLLCYDVATRWGSSLRMVERILSLVKPYNRACSIFIDTRFIETVHTLFFSISRQMIGLVPEMLTLLSPLLVSSGF